jgi:7-cyano-7-deazaguanine synthase
LLFKGVSSETGPKKKEKIRVEVVPFRLGSSDGGKAVFIVSGGLDSVGTASYWKNKDYDLYLMTFFYGQRAKVEGDIARELGKKLGAVDHKFIDISFMKNLYGSTNVLTDETKEMPSQFRPSIIVPIRNAIFLAIATAWAFSIKASIVAYGAHLTDNPYPDCRPEFAKSLASTLNLGDIDAMNSGEHPGIEIWSPAIANLEKWEMLKISYGLLREAVYRTWSCYLDGPVQCGKCESCRNRRLAFNRAGIPDKTKYRSLQ